MGLYAGLLAFNVLAWLAALLALQRYPPLLGMAGLSYVLGLRHAVDANHIAAIDNTTRKLMQAGQRPIAVGLFFSLGHSTVVLLASMFLAAGAAAMTPWIARYRDLGSLLGSGVSAAFLLAIALMNAVILCSTYSTLRQAHRAPGPAQELGTLLAHQGPLARLCKPLFGLITRSWHLYPLGLIFGLAFDTAIEIGALGISASQATRGLPLASILVFPVLFTAAMCLVDTLDGTLMVGAYEWAFIWPARKLYYNIIVTCTSVLIALLVGALEALQLLTTQLRLNGPPWRQIEALNGRFTALGCLIIGVFASSWLLAALIYRFSGAADLEARAAAAQPSHSRRREVHLRACSTQPFTPTLCSGSCHPGLAQTAQKRATVRCVVANSSGKAR
jgi:high-affinity nickel-transport protein